MKRIFSLSRTLDLDARLAALGEALELAEGRLPAQQVARGRELQRRAAERLGLGTELTVAALAGATGSGKSSLFNSLAGLDLSATGVRRPTTGEAHACAWGDVDADRLLDWLGVTRRHRRREADPDLEGLVLLDLPDHDSTELAHRVEVDRLIEVVDLFVWVLDPQKYADAAVHDRYLRRLAAHGAVTVVVLNHVDRLSPVARDSCLGDLRRLLREEGFDGVPVMATSARTGEGLADLRDSLTQRVATRRAASERLSADLEQIGGELSSSCDASALAQEVSARDRARLVDALEEAAGVAVVAEAVAKSHVHRAALSTGWPFTRWLRRLRPDPLRRLHLGSDFDERARTSIPAAGAVSQARVASAIRRVSEASASGMRDPWPTLVRTAATRDEKQLPDLLDRAVAGAGVVPARDPRWWRAVGVVQIVLALAAAAGALWLVALFGLEWLKVPDPPLPEIGEIPLPTLLLLGGLIMGLVLAGVARQFARIGARRRSAAARRRLRSRVADVADRHVLAPVSDELAAYEKLCAALRLVRAKR